jgi:hypothetical protein
MLEGLLDFICNMEDIPYGSVHSNGILDPLKVFHCM